MLELRGVRKQFGDSHAVLADVNLQLNACEYIAIMGESGVGKSTLLNIVAGLDMPDAGEVLFEDMNLARLDDNKLTSLRREKMGFVFQAFHLLPYLNVFQNVALPLTLKTDVAMQTRARVEEILDAVGLNHRSQSAPRELSGGEMQRVAIARALVHCPALILADEPTGNLDPTTGERVLELLRAQIKRTGAGGILVTHSLEAARTADKTYRLTSEGLIVGC